MRKINEAEHEGGAPTPPSSSEYTKKLIESNTTVSEITSILTEGEAIYDPPAGARANAKKVLGWIDKYGRDEVGGMTRVGMARANQLASGDKVSLDIVKRMAQFARHKKNAKVNPENKDTPWKDHGLVAWLGWGGDAGIEWAKKTLEKLASKNEAVSPYNTGKFDVDEFRDLKKRNQGDYIMDYLKSKDIIVYFDDLVGKTFVFEGEDESQVKKATAELKKLGIFNYIKQFGDKLEVKQ